MFGKKAEARREAEYQRREKIQKAALAARDRERVASIKARGFLDAGDYSAAATECHRAYQASLVSNSLAEVLYG